MLDAMLRNGDVAYIGGCKAGLIVLTLLVGKGELLKQAAESDSDVAAW